MEAVPLIKQQLHGHLTPILQVINVRDAGYCWGNKDEKIYIHQLCVGIGCRLYDLPRAIANEDRGKREREREREK